MPTRIFTGAKQKATNGLIQQLVGSDENGVGYVSLYFAKGLYSIPYAGVPCTLRNAKSGQYGGTRNFYMVTRGQPKGVAKSFLKWIKTSAAASKIIGTNWIPLS